MSWKRSGRTVSTPSPDDQNLQRPEQGLTARRIWQGLGTGTTSKIFTGVIGSKWCKFHSAWRLDGANDQRRRLVSGPQT